MKAAMGAKRERSEPRGARSVHTLKQLEISSTELLQQLQTKADKERRNLYYQKILVNSVQKICRGIEVALSQFQPSERDLEGRCAFCDFTKARPKLCPVCAKHKRLKSKLKLWGSALKRLRNCQTEWIGYKATCCKTSIAIPVGCNHRLCFLCNHRRVEKYRQRVNKMLARLKYPVLLTLTIPNRERISKGSFSDFRRYWNRFRKGQPWLCGGLYSLETTYNKSLSSTPWHLHSHILGDSTFPIPSCECGVCSQCGHRWQTGQHCHKCGARMPWRFLRSIMDGCTNREHGAECKFIRFKRRIEFDWLLCTGGFKAGWRYGSFAQWYSKTEPDYPWRSAAECAEWQSRHRRSVDIRRVHDRKKAAFEIVKYICKASAFADNPRAIAEFGEAARGARCLQTFGTWYGLKLSENEDVNAGRPCEANDWNHLQCDCGRRQFVNLGRMFSNQVVMDSSGQYHVKKEFVFPGACSTGPPG